MSEKISPEHLTRIAYVYVRQSSLHQVRHHREGLERQYALAERAQSLGFRQVVVIDDDLGVTGAGTHERPGFGRLLTAICQKAAGAVVALEASRFARNNRDWHHLIDLCAMTDTLLIDDDGVYDPRLINDRLLLGLKGTMSEFELSLLHQRAREAFEQKVKRGCVLWQVPVGFVRTEEYQVEKSPTGKCSRRSNWCSRSFASWAVRVRRCCGFATSRSACRRACQGRTVRRSFGGCPASVASTNCCVILLMPGRLPMDGRGRNSG